MDDNRFHWPGYYQRVSGREPRPLMLDVLSRFETENSTSRQAVDLGCGDGTETALLLANGWHVVAVDGEPAAFDLLKAKIPDKVQSRLQTQVTQFEDVQLSPADLIYAGYSIPFCHPDHFDAMWQKVVNSITSGARFAGQLFGIHDTWADNADMTFFNAEQARAYFDGLELEHFHEEDADGRSSSGPKHWHVFHVIARKQ